MWMGYGVYAALTLSWCTPCGTDRGKSPPLKESNESSLLWEARWVPIMCSTMKVREAAAFCRCHYSPYR